MCDSLWMTEGDTHVKTAGQRLRCVSDMEPHTFVSVRPPLPNHSLSFHSVPHTSNLPLCNLSITLLSHHLSSCSFVKRGVWPSSQSPVLHQVTESAVSMQQQCCAFFSTQGSHQSSHDWGTLFRIYSNWTQIVMQRWFREFRPCWFHFPPKGFPDVPVGLLMCTVHVLRMMQVYQIKFRVDSKNDLQQNMSFFFHCGCNMKTSMRV